MLIKMGNQVVLTMLIICLAARLVHGQTTATEEVITIPTWELGAAEVHPVFPGTFAGYHTNRKIYPYPYKVNLTQQVSDKEYIACWLENEFVKVLITPEIGGRLYGAKDKTNDHNYMYWQPTVKPALIGLTGAWVSGGIEWNYPSSHRHTSFSPVSYRTVENADGSKTVWVGETERVYGLRWIVGTTIYPGKSVLEAKIRLMNPGSLQHSFYMWATTAQNANENTQLIYPTKLMTNHGEERYNHWPVHEGMDLSFWKNTPNARSYFSVDKGGFFGSYDVKKNVGTAIVGNEHIMIGKKFWTWGTSPSGRIWDHILSDGEGPYIEPQAGMYASNQPDFHWIVPQELKSFSLFFFPVKGIGSYKYANQNGALNLEEKENSILIGVYSTAILDKATIHLASNSTVLFSKEITLDPSKPFVEELDKLNPGEDRSGLELTLFDSKGQELLSYRTSPAVKADLPEGKKPFAKPGKVGSTNELYHIAEHLYRFREQPVSLAYFDEILARDSLHSGANVLLAEMAIKEARYNQATDHLQRAAKRDKENGKIHYLNGLANKALRNYHTAYDQFYRSTHDQRFLTAGHKQLALLKMRQTDWEWAIRHLNTALDFNRNSAELLALLSVAYRMAGQYEAAFDMSVRCLESDPLSALGLYEKMQAELAMGKQTPDSGILFEQVLLRDYQNYLDLSAQYLSAGLYTECIKVLDLAIVNKLDQSALIYYYKGFSESMLGRETASQSFTIASQQSDNYVFPFRSVALEVFKKALEINPEDAQAYYYMGMVYAGKGQIDQAKGAWEKAVLLNKNHAKSYRNLGLLYANDEDKSISLSYYQKAFSYAPEDASLLVELYKVMVASQTDAKDRYKLLRQNVHLVEQKDDLLLAYLNLLVANKEYKTALKYYTTHTFNNWEGGYQIHAAYVYACMQMAEDAKDPREALDFYAMANAYPENLRVAARKPDWTGFISYPMAKAYLEMGNKVKSDSLLRHAAAFTSATPTMVIYYKALALDKLGKKQQAATLMDSLGETGKQMVEKQQNPYLVALGYYYQAKYYEFRGDDALSKQMMNEALSRNAKIASRAINTAKMNYANADATY